MPGAVVYGRTGSATVSVDALGAAGFSIAASDNDVLLTGDGGDLVAGLGADAVDSRDGTRDTDRCGAGADTVTVTDVQDAVATDCETRRP